MRRRTFLFCFLCLCQVSGFAFLQQKCSLKGRWKNELGSNMTVKAVDGSGLFTGSYFTAVSTQQGAHIKESALSGQVQLKHPVFGFLVKWSFVESVTSWVGQCFVSQTGEERLETTWLLRGKAKTEGDDWSQTRVGKDVFTRLP